MGFGSILKGLAGAGSIIAAPFTGGTSLSWLPAVLGGASAIGGALENTKGARTSTSTTTQQDSPENAAFANILRQMLQQRLATGGLPGGLGGYEANGIGTINDTFGGIERGLNARLTSRGLGGSPIAGNALMQNELARGGEIARFSNTLPLLQRQLANEDLGMAQGFYNAQPRTMTTTGVGPGSVAGGAFSNAAEMLAFLAGRGALGGGGSMTPKISTPNMSLDIGALLRAAGGMR